MTIKPLSATSCFVNRSHPQFAGEPVIDTELARTKAEQTDKEEHVQDFRKVEEIVDPVERRKSFRFGLNERILNRFRAAGDKQFVGPGDSEKQPDRNAYQQDGIWFQITATQQRKLDQPFPIHLLSLQRGMCGNDTPYHTFRLLR